MAIKGRALVFTILMFAALLMGATCRRDKLDLPVPDPQPAAPFESSNSTGE